MQNVHVYVRVIYTEWMTTLVKLDNHHQVDPIV